nr:MAK10-like protein [Tanacetum cinerariifolium]
MRDKNPIRTLGDYSKPSYEGYRNTIELPLGNNMVPLQSDTIRLVQNGCSFHELRSEDPNQHLKDFLKLVDSLDLDDNESWNDPRDFAKPVKAIALPQDILSTSDRHLIKLKNQVQCLMEDHLALTQPPQVNKITTSYEICSSSHDTQYYMEDLEQAFVEYASSCTDEAGGLVTNFMASQDARLSKFEADFKYQQSEMTNKIDTILKVIADQIAGTLPSDIVKNPKLSTTLVLSARSYPTVDSQIMCEHNPTLPLQKLNIEPLEETDHVFGLADGTKSYPVGIVKDVEVNIGKLKLLSDFYVIDIKKDPETPFLVERGFLATANVIIDCRMAKIVVEEGITKSVFGVKGVDLGEEEAPYWTTHGKRKSYKPRPRSDGIGAQTPYYARKDFLDCHLLKELEIARDAELNLFKDTLVFRRMVEFLGVIPINLKSNM